MLKETKKEVWSKGVGGPVVWAFSAHGGEFLDPEGGFSFEEGVERGEEEVEGEEIDVDVCLVYRLVGEEGKDRGDKDFWNESHDQGWEGGQHSLVDENVVYFNGEEGGYFAVPLERAVRVEGIEGVVGEEVVFFSFIFFSFIYYLFILLLFFF